MSQLLLDVLMIGFVVVGLPYFVADLIEFIRG